MHEMKSFGLVARAEKIISSTLAYQASIVVDKLKDRLDLGRQKIAWQGVKRRMI